MKSFAILCFVGGTFFAIFWYRTLVQNFQKAKLKDIDVLTLHQGRMTSGRRSCPIPQLELKFFARILF